MQRRHILGGTAASGRKREAVASILQAGRRTKGETSLEASFSERGVLLPAKTQPPPAWALWIGTTNCGSVSQGNRIQVSWLTSVMKVSTTGFPAGLA